MEKKGRLLIVDDEPEIVELLKDLLEDQVQEVVTALDGEQALAKVKDHPFDAILSDINMPRMNGLELLRRLREQGVLTPFVVLTAHGDRKSAVEALKLNAYDFLDKPWNPKVIQSIMTKAVELGLQYNEWSSDKDLVDSLQGIRDQNAKEALFRIKANSNPKS